jgi:hypothetical protein
MPCYWSTQDSDPSCTPCSRPFKGTILPCSLMTWMGNHLILYSLSCIYVHFHTPLTLPWTWKQYSPLKHMYPTTLLYGVTSQKTNWIFIIVKTSHQKIDLVCMLDSWKREGHFTRQKLTFRNGYPSSAVFDLLFMNMFYLHKVRCMPRPAVCFLMSRPTPVKPENINLETWLCVTRICPTSASPGNTLITPGGNLQLKICNCIYYSCKSNTDNAVVCRLIPMMGFYYFFQSVFITASFIHWPLIINCHTICMFSKASDKPRDDTKEPVKYHYFLWKFQRNYLF